MKTLAIITYEVRRILLTRTYLYSLLLLVLFAHNILSRLLVNGVYGAAPYSPVSFIQYLVILNPLLLAILMLWCAAVFSESQISVRRIIFSTPISEPAYWAIRSAAIVVAYLLTTTVLIGISLAFYAYQFGIVEFVKYISPILAFLIPPAVFVIGFSFAAGRLNPRLPYGLIPLILFAGIFNLGLPFWLDISANNFMLAYPKLLMRYLGTGDMIYFLPPSFIATRIIFILTGLALLVYAATRRQK